MSTDPFRADVFSDHVRLPHREFMYTLDQIAYMLDIDEIYMTKNYLYLPGGRSPGSAKGRIRCTNIARSDQTPNWRVSESDFKLWMKQKGVRFTVTKGRATGSTAR